jgi:hypothetical protein
VHADGLPRVFLVSRFDEDADGGSGAVLVLITAL